MKRAAAATAVLCLVLGLSATAGAGSGTKSPYKRSVAVKNVRVNKGLPKMMRGRPDALSRARALGRLSDAQYSLERARSLYRLNSVRARWGAVSRPHGRDATLILRDLAVRLKHLKGRAYASAKRILARPTDGAGGGFGDKFGSAIVRTHCGTRFCFHWTETTSSTHVVPLDDVNANTFPDYVDMTMSTFDTVYANEVETLGFRPPKSDETSENNEGNAMTDVYLVNIGKDGLYGYCTTDDPNFDRGSKYEFYDASAFCAVDNDFTEAHFQALSPEQNMQVTAAHEFFHAVQFAYDILEDGWLLEGTAAWMEDVVYDDVNDNYQYLKTSALRKPGLPIDYHSNNFNSADFSLKYGAFLWWRFLAEILAPEGVVHDPLVIKEVWEQVDGSEAAQFGDLDSLKGTIAVVKARGANFRAVFNLFGNVNYFPETFYEEGAGYLEAVDGKRPKTLKTFTLSTSKKTTGSFQTKLLHLSNGYVLLRPGSGAGEVRVVLDGPPTSKGTNGSLTVINADGTLTFTPMTLNGQGNGSATVPLGGTQGVLLTLTNASTRYKCFRQTVLACQGVPKDDKVPFVFTATLK